MFKNQIGNRMHQMNFKEDFEYDFRWQVQRLPLALDIIGKLPVHLFTAPRIAPRETDIKCNTDLILVPFGGRNIAMRLRRPKYFRSYGLQFTIRSERRRTQAETELSKIRRGLGDWFFYGFIEEGWSP
jgi:hypothetical protein